jgi:hypothetical protein
MSKTQMTPDQIRTLLDAHCHRVVNNMDWDDLANYAIQMMKESFDTNPGTGDTDVYMLLTDIQIAEDNDEDAMFEFIHGEIGDADIAQELVNMAG